ncbi:hypothetical protein PM082_024099 [Marasmius tenuissimus]|nr:hypothetical protein PM082_024099 [Marasmius tenuissimus]
MNCLHTMELISRDVVPQIISLVSGQTYAFAIRLFPHYPQSRESKSDLPFATPLSRNGRRLWYISRRISQFRMKSVARDSVVQSYQSMCQTKNSRRRPHGVFRGRSEFNRKEDTTSYVFISFSCGFPVRLRSNSKFSRWGVFERMELRSSRVRSVLHLVKRDRSIEQRRETPEVLYPTKG